jgi:hypothetical protein
MGINTKRALLRSQIICLSQDKKQHLSVGQLTNCFNIDWFKYDTLECHTLDKEPSLVISDQKSIIIYIFQSKGGCEEDVDLYVIIINKLRTLIYLDKFLEAFNLITESTLFEFVDVESAKLVLEALEEEVID